MNKKILIICSFTFFPRRGRVPDRLKSHRLVGKDLFFNTPTSSSCRENTGGATLKSIELLPAIFL